MTQGERVTTLIEYRSITTVLFEGLWITVVDMIDEYGYHSGIWHKIKFCGIKITVVPWFQFQSHVAKPVR